MYEKVDKPLSVLAATACGTLLRSVVRRPRYTIPNSPIEIFPEHYIIMSLQQIMYAYYTNVYRTININKLLYTCIYKYKNKKYYIE